MSLQSAGFEDSERRQAAASSLSTRAILCEPSLDTFCTTLHHIRSANVGVAHYALVECHRKAVVRPRLHPITDHPTNKAENAPHAARERRLTHGICAD